MTDFTPDPSLNALIPQNIEAEEIILGGILFDPNAMAKVIDLLPPEAFYIQAHRHIYEAARVLYFQGNPIDLMTVATWLNDHKLLEKIGSTAKLASLVDRTVTAINVERYVPLLMGKYLRRLLINAGREIVELGFDTIKDLDIVLDEAEQKIFNLTQSRIQQGLVPISDTLIDTFSHIEKLHQKLVLPGISCGFYDVDSITSGFQRSDLIIIAGRPAMGKCLAYNSEIVLDHGKIATIEDIYHTRQSKILTLNNDWQFTLTQPSQFIDDGLKPVFRLTTKLGRLLETTITHPYLTIQGWKPLDNLKVGDRIAVPRKINIFGQETISTGKIKVLAYLLGDGCLTHIFPQFTNSNPALRDDFSESVKSNFMGVKTKIRTANNRENSTVCVTRDLNFIKKHRQKFAQQLQGILKTKSITIQSLANKLQVHINTIRNWLKANTVPSLHNFNKLCDFLEVEPQTLIPFGLNSLRKNSQNNLKIWLQEIEILGKIAQQKTIPNFIFKLEKESISLFINRLFATNGWITILKNNQVQLGYETVSEKLARQLQHLLLRFGVISSLKKLSLKYKNKLKETWQINITDPLALKSFTDDIGIFGKEKLIFAAKKILENRRFYPDSDLIPQEIWQYIKQLIGGAKAQILANQLSLKEDNVRQSYPRELSRQELFEIGFALNNLNLQQLANSDVYWDEIVSIEPMGIKKVYDLTIPQNHNFIANDICVHNTSFALNIAANVAKQQDLTVAIFSLEMSREQLTMRLLSGEAKIDSNKLKSGRITENEMEPLAEAVGNLSALPIYIDDTGNLTVRQMRSEVRRLQAETKGNLGLVLLDYLQLMEGSSKDTRVQEISQITRSLKSLAREINTPIIALSQLSRAVEQRTVKRPMLSDLRESGCLTGDALITLADRGEQIPIRDLINCSNFTVLALNENTWKLEKAIVSNVFATGIKPVFRLTTRVGSTIRATNNHQFLTFQGWKRLEQICVGDRLAIPRKLNINDQKQTLKHLERVKVSNIAKMVKSSPLIAVSPGDIYWDEVIAIDFDGIEPVFDLTVPNLHNFVANNLIVHNSIEQDADLVLMLYRDEYYNPDSVDKGIAEIIIAKHRNGPTGQAKLIFKPELTQFLNLQKREY